ncbi:alpha/beta fold hydrolase [Erythrobacter sp. LQ02-29]|uniref:alpha/beta fold hydrolase BchO n=1 Tax=Erythrobacter sp. LQ02-29 TaxID=2920384 RepID=UPI001F4DA986|nr:alpha/beta fold hydrolase BchO [Erythrobacter sp. LQ02-29]MCP9221149.1 alpha/beta fold hydrolase [Erythrobacter sp. LQ02-29]
MSRPDWQREGRSWPNREASTFVRAGSHRWHVQRGGSGPNMLLLHGTGAATHSWGPIWPLLAERFTLLAPDLPGHGFTSPRASGILSLPYVSRAVADLLREEDFAPHYVLGHSAGAAIALRMALDGLIAPERIVALAGAILPMGGAARHLFPAAAKLLFLNPLVPSLMAWRARSTGAVDRMLAQTGSRIDARQRDLYASLFRHSSHVDAALALMANWDLEALARDLPQLETPLTLLVPEGDGFVPPAQQREVAKVVEGAEVRALPGLGHLAHEEDAEAVARAIEGAVADAIGE